MTIQLENRQQCVFLEMCKEHMGVLTAHYLSLLQAGKEDCI